MMKGIYRSPDFSKSLISYTLTEIRDLRKNSRYVESSTEFVCIYFCHVCITKSHKNFHFKP